MKAHLEDPATVGHLSRSLTLIEQDQFIIAILKSARLQNRDNLWSSA